MISFYVNLIWTIIPDISVFMDDVNIYHIIYETHHDILHWKTRDLVLWELIMDEGYNLYDRNYLNNAYFEYS